MVGLALSVIIHRRVRLSLRWAFGMVREPSRPLYLDPSTYTWSHAVTYTPLGHAEGDAADYLSCCLGRLVVCCLYIVP